jgi:hypothetical protein
MGTHRQKQPAYRDLSYLWSDEPNQLPDLRSERQKRRADDEVPVPGTIGLGLGGAARATGRGLYYVLAFVAVNVAVGLVGVGLEWFGGGSTYNGPSGATAVCDDGTVSYSAHHSGTCSWHGGVRAWNPDR